MKDDTIIALLLDAAFLCINISAGDQCGS